MNNKGFTLIELIVVIGILGLMGIIVTSSLTKSLKDQNQKNCDIFVKELEEAACVYAELKNKDVNCDRSYCPPLRIDTLLKAGLLKSEVNACTGKVIDDDQITLNSTVTVSWSNEGEKSCVYNGVKIYEGNN